MQGERLRSSSSFREVAEIKPSKEEIGNLYNGYKDLLDDYGGNGDRIKGVGAVLSFDLKKFKITTEVEIEGKKIPLVAWQLRTKTSKGHIIIDMGTRINHGELAYLELSERHASWMYPERSLLDDALGKILGRNIPTKKDLNIYSNAFDIAKKQFADFPQNNPNKV